MKHVLGSILIAFVLVATVSAQTADLTGKWKIRWPAPGKPNVMTLSVSEKGYVSGVFIADSGENCPVDGMLFSDTSTNFDITCKKFAISMEGMFSTDDGQEIKGTYSSAQFPSGNFTMEKQICLLPEGCGIK